MMHFDFDNLITTTAGTVVVMCTCTTIIIIILLTANLFTLNIPLAIEDHMMRVDGNY